VKEIAPPDGRKPDTFFFTKTKPDSRKQKPRQTLAWAWATGILQFPKSKREKSQFFWPVNPTTPALVYLENKTSNTLNKKKSPKKNKKKLCRSAQVQKKNFIF
jgi:hypothetical protein